MNNDNASEFLMTSLGLNRNVLGRCDKEEVEEKYLQYMKEVEVDWDRWGDFETSFLSGQGEDPQIKKSQT